MERKKSGLILPGMVSQEKICFVNVPFRKEETGIRK
jgi:hypothetical protein